MPTVTVTTTAAANTLRLIENGVIPVSFSRSTGTFGGIGDTVLLAKIPNKATVLGGDVRFVSPSDAAVAVEVLLGTDQVMATTTASNTGGAVVLRGRGVPVKLSLSDDAANLWSYLTLKVANAGTQTATGSVSGVIYYSMDAE